MKKKNIILLIPILVLMVFGSLIVKFAKTSYTSLNLPAFAPKGFVFFLAWTIFYLILYYSACKTIETINIKNRLFQLYNLIFVFQFLWLILFFCFSFYLVSLFCLIVLYFISVSYVYLLSKSNVKLAYLNVFYLIWLLFAFLLNLSIMILN